MFQLGTRIAKILPEGIMTHFRSGGLSAGNPRIRSGPAIFFFFLFGLFFKEKSLKSFKIKQNIFSNIWFYRSRIRVWSSIGSMFYSKNRSISKILFKIIQLRLNFTWHKKNPGLILPGIDGKNDCGQKMTPVWPEVGSGENPVKIPEPEISWQDSHRLINSRIRFQWSEEYVRLLVRHKLPFNQYNIYLR